MPFILTLDRKTRRSQGQNPGPGVRNQESDIRIDPTRLHATMSRMKTLSGKLKADRSQLKASHSLPLHPVKDQWPAGAPAGKLGFSRSSF